jgi:hypothetical protein
VSAIEFAPEGPELRAPAAVVRWLVDDEGAPPDELTEGGAVHPRLDLLRATMRDAAVELWLERGGRQGRGWLTPTGAVIAHPLPDGRTRIVMVPPALLLDALVRLNDVGPRPHPDPGLRIVAEPAALAQALAAREPSRLRLDDPAQREAFAAIVGGLREHWRVAVRWEPAEGAAPGRVLEVVDSEAGYWVVVPDAARVELWPTTPTDVFRALGQLFPLTAEMAAWTPS